MGKLGRMWMAGVLALVVVAPLPAQVPSPAAQEAARLYGASDWPAAAEAYRALVRETPEDAVAWLRLGRALVELERPTEALEALDRALAAELQTPFLHLYRARALTQAGRADEALDALETIQPSPALGGAAVLRSAADLAPLRERARFQAVAQALEAAAFPCRADPVSREFDFWVGEWEVYANGQRAGTNVVEPILEGCALLENWTNVGGREGKSFNWVDRSTFREPRWRQLWVADQGNTLDYYHGRYADGAMRFHGHTFSPQGDSIPQKLTFHNVHPDTVRQVFEQSNDGGATWVVTWEGLYVRKKEGGR